MFLITVALFCFSVTLIFVNVGVGEGFECLFFLSKSVRGGLPLNLQWNSMVKLPLFCGGSILVLLEGVIFAFPPVSDASGDEVVFFGGGHLKNGGLIG